MDSRSGVSSIHWPFGLPGGSLTGGRLHGRAACAAGSIVVEGSPMFTTAAPPEARVLLHDISWGTYQRLLAERGQSPGTRFTYDDGELEIMVVYIGHEGP